MNKKIYKELRPGDDFELRKKIIEATEKVGLGIDNTLMIGLGEDWNNVHPYEDWVEFLYYFKQFRNLKIIEIHPFTPIKNSLVQNRPPGSEFESEKARAIARLIMRNIDIACKGLTGILAGGNLAMHVWPITKKFRAWKERAYTRVEELGGDLVLVDNLHLTISAAKEIGMKIEL